MAQYIETEEFKKYILKIIKNRAKLGQEPTGDDLYAVLGHLVNLQEGVQTNGVVNLDQWLGKACCYLFKYNNKQLKEHAESACVINIEEFCKHMKGVHNNEKEEI